MWFTFGTSLTIMLAAVAIVGFSRIWNTPNYRIAAYAGSMMTISLGLLGILIAFLPKGHGDDAHTIEILAAGIGVALIGGVLGLSFSIELNSRELEHLRSDVQEMNKNNKSALAAISDKTVGEVVSLITHPVHGAAHRAVFDSCITIANHLQSISTQYNLVAYPEYDALLLCMRANQADHYWENGVEPDLRGTGGIAFYAYGSMSRTAAEDIWVRTLGLTRERFRSIDVPGPHSLGSHHSDDHFDLQRRLQARLGRLLDASGSPVGAAPSLTDEVEPISLSVTEANRGKERILRIFAVDVDKMSDYDLHHTLQRMIEQRSILTVFFMNYNWYHRTYSAQTDAAITDHHYLNKLECEDFIVIDNRFFYYVAYSSRTRVKNKVGINQSKRMVEVGNRLIDEVLSQSSKCISFDSYYASMNGRITLEDFRSKVRDLG